MVGKGFRFGMILQLAIGPMCLLVFHTAAEQGFWTALLLVSAIALIDALFVFLSEMGVSAVLNRPRIKKCVRFFGAFVLILFGLDMSLGVFHIELLPSLNLFGAVAAKSVFWKGILLTASNPLTILFWSGVFSTQMIENGYDRHQMFGFGAGCVLATVSFLSFVAAIGVFIGSFISTAIMNGLNFCVGLLIAYFGCKMAVKKE